MADIRCLCWVAASKFYIFSNLLLSWEKKGKRISFYRVCVCAKNKDTSYVFVLVDPCQKEIESEKWEPKVTKRGKTFCMASCSSQKLKKSRDGYSHVYEASSIMFEVMRSSYSMLHSYYIPLHACLKKPTEFSSRVSIMWPL